MCGRDSSMAYRVYGPYDPERGMRFNSSKLLIDPYAKAIAGQVNWADEMFGYVVGGEQEDLARDFRDDAWGMPKAAVIDHAFDWGNDKRPGIPLHSSIIYEVHVKGFTQALSGRARGIARHLCGPRQRRRDQIFEGARRYRGGIAAGASRTSTTRFWSIAA